MSAKFLPHTDLGLFPSVSAVGTNAGSRGPGEKDQRSP
jgi:hypothetical protein